MKKASIAAAVLFVIVFLLPAAEPAMAGSKMGVPGESAQSMHLKPNQSSLIDTDFKVRRISVGKPEIADVTVVTPKQLMVTGKTPGITTLIYWNDMGLPTSVDLHVYAENGIRGELKKYVPNENFEVGGSQDTIILSGKVSSDTAQNRLVDAAKAYSKNVVNLLSPDRMEQIMIQVRVAEVDRSAVKELGFGVQSEQSKIRGSLSPGNAFSPFFGNLRDQEIGNVGPNFSFSDAMNLFVAKPGAFPKFAAFIRALSDKGSLRMLAEPNLVVANGAEGKFLAGGEFPVVYTTASGGGSAVSVVYKEFGVRLHFQPRIAPNGEIFLKVAQEVSELDFANAVLLSGFRIPALKSRKAESSLQLADGQSFVLAGLIDNKISKQVAKIPLLGDIPVLGTLFRSTRYQNNETELMVMVTPRIVRPLEKGAMPSLPTDRMKPEETSPSMFK